MNDISEQRPDFYEGEYLAAADLEQLVIYLRDQGARHALGGHSWGIVAGLQLVEQSSPTGDLDVYLLPGYAVDGYGRSIVVINPVRLTPDLFAGQATGAVELWLRYDQGATQGTRPGFQVCSGSDSYSRIAESYVLMAGTLSTVQAQSGITVAGEAVDDPRTAPRLFDDTGPIACDGSVPYQDLPLADEEKSQWWIPLGWVGWQNGSPAQLVALTDAQRTYSRRLRRYLGVVAENILAADGLIRLRRRTMALPAGQTVDQTLVDNVCSADDLAYAAYDSAIAMCNGEPTFKELVWVEGRLRVTDDVRVLGGRVELRDVNGTDYIDAANKPLSVPLFLARQDSDPNADLNIMIGASGTNPNPNRLLVSQATVKPPPASADACAALDFTTQTVLSVLDTGKVGIGTDSPDEQLTIDAGSAAQAFAHFHSSGADVYVGAGEVGAVIASSKDVRVRAGVSDPTDDKKTWVTVTTGGQVGIGTESPDTDSLVTLEGASSAYLYARTTDGSGNGNEIVVGADDNYGAFVSAAKQGNDLVLGADAQKPFVFVKASGNVGVGTQSPGSALTVQGKSDVQVSVVAMQGGQAHDGHFGADSAGAYVSAATTGDSLWLRTNDQNRVVVTDAGNVGIGTTGPAQALEVVGNIKLGGTAQYYAAAGFDNWLIIAGSLDAGGNVLNGTGFTASFDLANLTFNVSYSVNFGKQPVVTVTPLNALVGGAAAWLTASAGNGFSARVSAFGTSLSFTVLGLH
ncbi:MAG TPA: hypothetical protein VIA18_12170 [Polyangia bacterium]|nr:hypothetical protein [Polyangia bacterium]